MRKILLAVLAGLTFSTGLAISASAQADTAVFDGKFEISATAVRLSEQVLDGKNTSGLRFKTDVLPNANGENAFDYQTGARCYTTLTVHATVDGETKDWTMNVAAEKWRGDGSGWNTVLANIPVESYAADVTAQSVIEVSETEVYVTETVVSSIAKTASWALNDGQTHAKLNAYSAGAVQEIALSESTLYLEQHSCASAILTAVTNPIGYGVVFSSADTSVAVVDKNGVVTAVAEGETTIFATMSGVQATCRVVVENCVGTSGHQWKVVKTAPTCTEQGFETRTCSDCGAVQVLNYVAALGHEWKVQTIAPTCEGKGYDKKVCTVCKHEVRENYVKASGHVYGADDVCDVCGKRKEDAGWTDWIPIG